MATSLPIATGAVVIRMAMVVVALAAMVNVLVWGGVGFDVVTIVVSALKYVWPVSGFVKVLSDVLVEALVVDIESVVLSEVYANVLAAVITALEIPVSIP